MCYVTKCLNTVLYNDLTHKIPNQTQIILSTN